MVRKYGKLTYTKADGETEGCLHYVNKDFNVSPIVDSWGGKGVEIAVICENCGAIQKKTYRWDEFGEEKYGKEDKS